MIKKRLILLAFLWFLGGLLPGQAREPGYWYGEGREAMLKEDWFGAVEDFLECLRLNPAHAEAAASLAECYYALGEFDQSLVWVRKARSLARSNLSLANLEASIQIALGFPAEAAKIVSDILAREPYNREALFTAAELDISRGRPGDAALRYREAVKRFPDDRRLFISLALTLSSLGEWESARSYIDRALVQHPGDYQVNYYAAYLYARAEKLEEAVGFAEKALSLKPGQSGALSLLASLRYRAGDYEEASRLADSLINLERENPLPWYLKGLCLRKTGRIREAIAVLSQAALIDGEDEFIRASLEELLISSTPLEDGERRQWALLHFRRAGDYRAASLIEQALFEYRRGLRLNPFARERRDYADLLRIQGYPGRYLEELRFLQDQGLGDKTLNDAVESYNALLAGSLFRRWGVDPVEVSRPHWKLAVFSLDSSSGFFHADAGDAAASYVRDILVHERNILPLEAGLPQENPPPGSFSAAFRAARDGGADYFLALSVSENERDLSLKGELYVARTGSPAAEFYAYRTGPDRLRYAARSIVDQLKEALPFRAELIGRRQAQGLIDKGRADGVKKDDVYQVLRKKSGITRNEGIGILYAPSDVVGTLTISEADEEIASGVLARKGFFDLISVGDEILFVKEEEEKGEGDKNRDERKGKETAPAAGGNAPQTDPALRSFLRNLRLSQ